MTFKISHNIKTIICALVAFVCLTCAWPAPALAEEARITDFVVTNTRDDLLIYLTLEGCFTKDIEEAILTGIPTTFSIFASLSRHRSFWMDKEIADLTITHSITYDSLKKEFTVVRSEKEGPPLVTRDFSEAKKAMSEVDSLKIVALDKLEKGHKYQVQAKAELDKVTLPLYLHYVLFFVSAWDFETKWYTIDFMY
ncbi:protein of unknown function [Desulfatibacillum alkenivorans DSM 16219]|uniref:DUF4390 domain-containing protein n=1 Tax=Desulfatibacillum alkenivorans DSM 16219 TaxID=1121393 RepID=A0A1M6HUL9_9BACT|nr:DUF4390 domain-containing protein [Desulfatibacillum alkenivorans]SHJ25926.1 protein of unknown function [Desulfatibacillum alkenivorans DSM 16219]